METDPQEKPDGTPEDEQSSAPYEVHCLRYNRVTGKMMQTVAHSEDESREFFDYSKDYLDTNNLEGPGPTVAERRENYKAIQALSIPERFALMFGRNRPTSEIPLDTNLES